MAISDSINLGKEVSVEIITPVHVGGASEKVMKRGVDFFWRQNKLMLFNISDLLKVLLAKNIGLQNITNLLADNRVRELEGYIFDTLKVQSTDFTFKELKTSSEPGNEIRPLVRNGTGNPYIPGSSIKGALRSVIFNNLYRHGSVPGSDYTKVDDLVLGKFDRSIMRFIRVGEPVFTNHTTDIGGIDLFNLYRLNNGDWESNWKNGFNLWVEYFQPGTKATFRLNIAQPLIQNLVKGYTKPAYLSDKFSNLLSDSPFDTLRKIINTYTREHINRELDFFNQFDQAKDTPDIIDNLKNLLAHTESDNSCLLRMSYGSGFHGITGDWRFKDHKKTVYEPDKSNWVYSSTLRQRVPAHYKSRKIIGSNPKLMGFVKLKF
jgi:hypothetical protein